MDLTGTTHTVAGTYNGDVWSFTDPTGNDQSASGTVNDVINQPATHPVIIGEQSLFSPKTNKKGRPVGKPILAAFKFEFNSPLNPASATNPANYQVDSVTTQRVREKVQHPASDHTSSTCHTATTRSRSPWRSRNVQDWWPDPRFSRA